MPLAGAVSLALPARRREFKKRCSRRGHGESLTTHHHTAATIAPRGRKIEKLFFDFEAALLFFFIVY